MRHSCSFKIVLSKFFSCRVEGKDGNLLSCLVAFFHSEKRNSILKNMRINRCDTGRPDKSDPADKFNAIIIQHPLSTDNDLIMFILTTEPGSNFKRFCDTIIYLYNMSFNLPKLFHSNLYLIGYCRPSSFYNQSIYFSICGLVTTSDKSAQLEREDF